MPTSKTLSKRILILSIVCLSDNGFAQEGRLIDGASNPELISDTVLFMSLSGLLESAGPNKCSTDAKPQGFSGTPTCLQIEGVDMAKAELLAHEFRAHRNSMRTIERSEFCDELHARRVPLNRGELAAQVSNFEQNSSIDRANFFMNRGLALLGQEGMNRLVSWAYANLRKDIDVREIDYADFMTNRNISPEQFLRAFCPAADTKEEGSR